MAHRWPGDGVLWVWFCLVVALIAVSVVLEVWAMALLGGIVFVGLMAYLLSAEGPLP